MAEHPLVSIQLLQFQVPAAFYQQPGEAATLADFHQQPGEAATLADFRQQPGEAATKLMHKMYHRLRDVFFNIYPIFHKTVICGNV